MNKTRKVLLTDYEFLFIIVGSIIDFSILTLPGTAVSVAKQDGWIAVLIGAVYPLYVILMAAIIIKKYPDTSIMELSKQYLGTIFGNLLNFLFMAQFLFYAIMVLGHGIHMLITFAVWFMTPFKIILVFTLLIVYGTRKGLKVLGRINVIAFCGLSILVLVAMVAFKYGSFLNLQPVFGAGWDKIAEGSISTAFAYANMELILIIHPYVKNKHKLIKLALISTAIIALFYTWSVFTTTLYLGPEIVTKSFWPFFFMSESVRIPVITNFRLILMLIWPLIIYKSVSTEYFMSTVIMQSITGVDFRKWCIFLAPVLLFLPLFFKSEVARMNFGDLVTPGVTIFNLAYISLIALLVAIKGNKGWKTNTSE